MGSVEMPIPYTPAEWSTVALLFRSEKLEDLKECYEYLQMWMSRMGDNTPVAIVCSSMFVAGAIKELEMKSTSEVNELKLYHGMTIIRFVNYTSEIEKNKDHTMNIIKSCGLQGIPRWIVEIRHNAAHCHMPTLDTLRKAIKFCCNWLIERFWDKPMHEAMVTVGVAQMVEAESEAAITLKNEVKASLNGFMRWRIQNMTVTNFETGQNPVLASIQKHVRRDPHVFLNMLVASGYLVMDDNQIRTSCLRVYEKWRVPRELQLIWAPVLKYLTDAGCFARFCEELLAVKMTMSGEGRRNEELQIIGWLNLVLNRALDPELEIFSADEWTSILYKIVRSPSDIPPLTVEQVMSKVPKVDEKVRRQVRRIMDISSETNTNADDSMVVYTAADLERLIQERAKKDLPERWGIFEPYDDLADPLPSQMGLAPGQTYDTVSLVITPEWLAEADEEYAMKQRESEVIEEETTVIVE